jgi:Zn-dependent protease
MKQRITPRQYIVHTILFLLTLGATTAAGAEWMTGRSFVGGTQLLGWNDWLAGLQFSLPFLGVLTVHEFGHFFYARAYRLKVSLPYYIPLWLGALGVPFSIGTMGAFIRIGSRFNTRQEFFDVGIAGPLAGFVAALGVLWYGFTHLPPPEHIFTIHPEYQQYGLDYAAHVYRQYPPGTQMVMGTNLLFEFFKHFVAPSPELVPNQYEIMHYPVLLAGYLSLFFTALNLIPIGQLDGGHILYGLLGHRLHKRISYAMFVVFMFYAGLGIFTIPALAADTTGELPYLLIYVFFLFMAFAKGSNTLLEAALAAVGICSAQMLVSYVYPQAEGFQGWLLFGFILGRVLGIGHPQALYDMPLSTTRQVLGWVSLLVFILCFSPQPFIAR